MVKCYRYCCLLALCFAACETTVEVDIPQYPVQLTANALFNPDSVWRVELTQNRFILDTAQFAPVPDAEVRVLQGGQTVAVLDYVGENRFTSSSIYRATNRRPQADQDYTLNIEHAALGSLLANSRTTSPQKLKGATIDTLDIRIDSDADDNSNAYAMTILIDDPPEENFYSVSFLERYDGFFADGEFGSEDYEVWFQNFTIRIPIQSDDPVIDSPFDDYRVELMFKDVSFNGEQYALKVYVPYFWSFSLSGSVLQDSAFDRQGNLVRVPGDTINRRTFYALLRTTTEEYYNYHYSRDLQASVESNPFAQPVQVYDNVENGLGIFAGYSQTEKEVTIK